MDQYSTEVDSGLVDKIVCEVKSQGLFDQFRRECLADVDTKPAYQNLQQRVESSVASFLSDQIWTPELNKNQLREKLRKNITEKGFLDTGVQRIVDQVVNPKLNSNFVPKIEDVAYKYLGIEKPIARMTELEIDTENHQYQEQQQQQQKQPFLPNLDLEQVSPESDKCLSVESHSPNAHIGNMMNDDGLEYIEDKMDDLESPAFEPIECKKEDFFEQDDDKMDICMGDSDDDQNKSNGFIANNCDEVKSNLSSISGLTSNESIADGCEEPSITNIASTTIDATVQVKNECEPTENIKSEPKDDDPPARSSPPEAIFQQFDAIEQPDEKPSIHYTNDVVENINQDSVLSQVSSNSRLSIITNNNTNTRLDGIDDDADASSGPTPSIGNGDKNEKESPCPYGISEEAQMQQFNESSSSNNGLVIDTDNVSNGTNNCDKKDELVAAFDINKEDIKFEGTERKSFDIDLSEPKVAIDENDHPTNGKPVETNVTEKEVAKTPDTAAPIASSTETSKDAQFKSEDVSSVSMTDVNDTSAKIASPKIENTSNDAKLRTDDSKGLDESSSTSSKHKESKSSSSTSSSSHRNGVESDSKNKSKDRHSLSSSSSSRHRSHSDRNKRSHSSSHSSLSKDKTKNSRDETDKRRHESSKHRSDERTSKSHHKSSSSSSNHKDKDRSRSDKKDNHRHSSSSQSTSSTRRDRDASSKHDSKHSDHKKSRSDSHRSGSHREKDDHESHKSKSISRQRSKSKDSNDGSTNPSIGLCHAIAPISSSTNTNQSASTAAQEPSTATDQQTSSEKQSTSTQSSSLSASENVPESTCSFSTPTETTSTTTTITSGPPFMADIAENDFVLTSQPVIVDQILAGNEMNLESFIDVNRDNPLISSIERTLADHAKVKKPKVAANIHEALKLIKVRKEIDRKKQKKLEQARVLAKQYMRSNLTTSVDDSQGVELEFACMSSGTNAPGPSISSPVKFAIGNEILGDEKPSTPIPPKEEVPNSVDETNILDFEGFSEEVSEAAKLLSQQFETAIMMMSSNDDNRQLFLENNKISESAATKSINIRKRKYTETSISAVKSASQVAVNDGEVASVVANVFIAPKDGSTSGRADATALDKQRQKTRYTNEDLFKPRPVLGGASRSRRRGINCND